MADYSAGDGHLLLGERVFEPRLLEGAHVGAAELGVAPDRRVLAEEQPVGRQRLVVGAAWRLWGRVTDAGASAPHASWADLLEEESGGQYKDEEGGFHPSPRSL